VEVERGRFQPLGEARQVLFLRLRASIPGVVGLTIKMIVVHGDLRETIKDVSGRGGMGLRSEFRGQTCTTDKDIKKLQAREIKPPKIAHS